MEQEGEKFNSDSLRRILARYIAGFGLGTQFWIVPEWSAHAQHSGGATTSSYSLLYEKRILAE